MKLATKPHKSRKPEAVRQPGPQTKIKKMETKTAPPPAPDKGDAGKSSKAAAPAPQTLPPVFPSQQIAANPITGTPTFRTIILPVETRNALDFNRKIIMTWQ